MGIIREPDGVEFTVIPVKLTARDRREISKCIAEHRRQHDDSEDVRKAIELLRRYEQVKQLKARDAKARNARERMEAKALALPSEERTQLAYQLLSSLAAENIGEPQREWASAAKAGFEQLLASHPPTKVNKKSPRRTKTAKA
ncbi:MAG: addiction module protein [Planctomycetaceae bacterium]